MFQQHGASQLSGDAGGGGNGNGVGVGGGSGSAGGGHHSLHQEGEDGHKVDYIVLHKLPNGEALNLETLRTYSMDDIEHGKVPEEKEGQDGHAGSGLRGMYEPPRDAPRSAVHSANAGDPGKGAGDTFGVNEGNDGLTIPGGRPKQPKQHSRRPPRPRMEDEGAHDWHRQHQQHHLLEQQQQQLPPEQLVVSERPPAVEEVYNPTPLKDLDVTNYWTISKRNFNCTS